jgi:hypothetical protein
MSARFIRRGTSKFFFAPAVVDKTTVTRAEITAAEDITAWVAEVNGWMLENNAVATPDMSSTFESSIPGTDSASDSSMTFYEDELADDVETTFVKGTAGHVILMRKGDKPLSESMDVFPVRVASRAAEYSAGNDPARTAVRFTITEEPALDTPVPA